MHSLKWLIGLFIILLGFFSFGNPSNVAPILYGNNSDDALNDPLYIQVYDIDNHASYDASTDKYTVVDSVGIGDDIAELSLNSKHNVYVIEGKQRKVAEFNIDLRKDSYTYPISKMSLYNLNRNKESLNRNVTLKRKIVNSAGEQWIPFNPRGKILKGNVTIGVFVDVLPGDNVDWVPKIMGKEMKEWAEWTEITQPSSTVLGDESASYQITRVDDEEKELYTSWIEDNNKLCIKANYESNLLTNSPIVFNDTTLEYKALPLYIVDDSNTKNFVDYIDFDIMKEKLLIDKKYCLYLDPEISQEYHLGFNSIVARTSSTVWQYGSTERLTYNSTGTLHILSRNPAGQSAHYWSNDNGTTWINVSQLGQGIGTNPISLLAFADDNLTFSYISSSILRQVDKNSSTGTWDSSRAILGNVTNSVVHYNEVVDSKDVLHYCIVSGNWFDAAANGDYLLYTNWTKERNFSTTSNVSKKVWANAAGNVGYNGQWVNNLSTDDTDFCDIEVGNNDTIFIVYTGSDTDNVYVSSSLDDFSTKVSVYDNAIDFVSPPAIAYDVVTDNIWLAWHDGSGPTLGSLYLANSTLANWKTNWTIRSPLINNSIYSLHVPTVKALNGSVIVMGQEGNASVNRTAYIVNSSNNFINWTLNNNFSEFNVNRSSLGVHPSMAWTNFPVWNRPHNNTIAYQTQASLTLANGSTDNVVYVGLFNSDVNYNETQEAGDSQDWLSSWDTDLKLVYKLDENNTGVVTTAVNSLNASRNLIMTNSPTGAPGKIGNATKFASSSSQYGLVSNYNVSTGQGNKTIAMWVNSTSNTNGQFLFCSGSTATGGGWGIAKSFSGTDGKIWVYRQAADLIAPTALNNSVWNFIAAVSAGNETRLYINGILVNSRQSSSINTGSAYVPTVGRSCWGTGYFDGTIDELYVWDRDLNQSDITGMYKNQTGLQWNGTAQQTPSSLGVTLVSPDSGTLTDNATQFYNATIMSVNANITNATIYIWNSSESVVYSANLTITPTTSVSLKTSYNFTKAGTYYWNYDARAINNTAVLTARATNNFTITFNNLSWYDTNYEYCFNISVRGASENLDWFESYINVNASQFGSYINTTSWGNLRFVNQSCNSYGWPMPYEIDVINSTAAGFWVGNPLSTGLNNWSIYITSNKSIAASENSSAVWKNWKYVYHFSENSGNMTKDSSYLGNNATTARHNNATNGNWTSGQIGNAIRFNGATSFMESLENQTAELTANGDRAILAFAQIYGNGKTSDLHQEIGGIGWATVNGRYYLRAENNDTWRLVGNGVANDYNTGINYTNNYNFHYAQHESGVSKWWVNATTSLGSFTHTYATLSAPIGIGGAVYFPFNNSVASLNGSIDEFRIANHSFTSAYVNRTYQILNYSNINVGTVQGLNGTGSNSCTYTSGNWIINCADNCAFSTPINLNRNNYTIVGAGTSSGRVTGARYLYNYNYGARIGCYVMS